MYGQKDSDIGWINSISDSRYIGKVCDKHPEMKGERRKIGYKCVKCVAESRAKYKDQPDVRARRAEELALKREYARGAAAIARAENALIRQRAGEIAIKKCRNTNWQPHYPEALEQLRAEGKVTKILMK